MRIGLVKRIQQRLFLAVAMLACLVAGVGVQAAKLTVKNNCSYTIYPGVIPAKFYSNGGWTMAPGSTVSFEISGSAGRVWSRTACDGSSPAKCKTGQCGGTGLQCAGTSGEPNTSLFEFTLNPSGNGTDFYNISYVDAVNPPIGIAVSNKSCVSPTTCSSAVISNCPADLRVDQTCLSPCTKYNTDQFCCRGAFGTRETCPVSSWSASAQAYVNNVHKYCPFSYSYAYDEGSGALQTCGTGIDYELTFCPSGSDGGAPPPTDATGGDSQKGGELNGTQYFTPGHSANFRMDAAKTAPNSPVGISAPNETGAQRWVFSNVKVKPAGHYNIAVSFGAFCVDVAGAGKAAGSKIVLTPCDGRISQSWKAVPLPNQKDKYTLRPAHAPETCLDVPNASQTAGTQLTIEACKDGAKSQEWQIDRLKLLNLVYEDSVIEFKGLFEILGLR